MKTEAIIGLIDLTSLTGIEEAKDITTVCESAKKHQVAAVCVYPQWVSQAVNELKDTGIPVATVVNFPSGNDTFEDIEKAITSSIAAGATEIDVVLPYTALKAGQTDEVATLLTKCRKLTEGHCLKVIIESGELTKDEIKLATTLVVDSGANFVKTSTGKAQKGATFEAVEQMLGVLKAEQQKKKNIPGLKISGGVSINNVDTFMQIAESSMGRDWMTKKNLRIGASSLLSQLAQTQEAKLSSSRGSLLGSSPNGVSSPSDPSPQQGLY